MKNNRNYEGKRVAPLTKKQRLWSDWGYLLVTAVIVVLMFRVILQLAWVPSGSMETTVPTRSLLISLRLPYVLGDPQPERGDVVTFWHDEMDKLLVKRVIGLPGETVSFQGGYVYVNGEQLDEPYLAQQGNTVSTNRTAITVPEGHLLFLGDNRGGSDDSRFWEQPCISLEKVRSRVLVAISVHKDNSWRGIRAIG